MRPRLAQKPDPIAAASSVRERASEFRLIAGKVLPLVPRGARGLTARDGERGDLLPYGLGRTVDGEPVAARVDVEEHGGRFERPELERIERGRDFYVTDGTGHALVRLSEPAARSGRLHNDVELHLDVPFRPVELAATAARRARTAFVRVLRAGDIVYLWGAARIELDDSGLTAEIGGYREAPRIAVFSGDHGPLHLYDEIAFRQLSAWQALPWYRKLSVLVRNR